MRLIESLVLTELGDEYVAVPTGAAAERLRGIIHLNATGLAIIKGLQQGLNEKKIAGILVDKYDRVDFEKALEDVKTIIKEMIMAGLIED